MSIKWANPLEATTTSHFTVLLIGGYHQLCLPLAFLLCLYSFSLKFNPFTFPSSDFFSRWDVLDDFTKIFTVITVDRIFLKMSIRPYGFFPNMVCGPISVCRAHLACPPVYSPSPPGRHCCALCPAATRREKDGIIVCTFFCPLTLHWTQ